MQECIFCKIVRGEIPHKTIYEDKDFLSFLDISKDCYGHTLVISKAHYEDITKIPADIFAKLTKLVQKISKHYIETCGFEGVNILNNCGECSGQTIFHIHFHIYPRKKEDNFKLDGKHEILERNFKAEIEKLKIN